MDYRLEICANGLESALRAERAGAYRIELCAGMPEGGTTPSYGEVCRARERLQIKLHAIVRPRGGDFLYNEYEREVLLADVELMHRLGADGIAVGALTADGDVDTELMREVMLRSGEMSVTFHRAFDMCRDQPTALEDLIALGCERVLTSGGAATAELGAVRLAKLNQQASGRIIIMPGCGVHAGNIAMLAQRTGACEFHLSARAPVESAMRYRHTGVSMGGTVTIDEYSRDLTSPDLVAAALRALSTTDRSY